MRRYGVKWIVVGVILTAGAGGAYVWFGSPRNSLPEGLAAGNGRIEATEIDIATKLAGRLEEVLVREGDMVARGQVLARMDTRELMARRHSAEAEMRRAEEERRYAAAVLAQQKSQYILAEDDFKRYRRLYDSKSIARQTLQRQETARDTARAAVAAASARQANATAAIDAVKARIDEIQSYIDDSTLTAPVDGRVLYRLAEPGEVLGAGGRLLTLLDVTDVTMTIFLPTDQAGRVDLGSDARIVLDARPDLVIPARVSYVAPKAQFTPKDVETRTEREKLMFRIKARIDPELLKKHAGKVKTGLPGLTYVRLADNVAWPPALATPVGTER